MKHHGSLGFSLLEVMIALGILAMSLTVLLESQASSVNNAGRSRDLSIATLLARSKMVDIERDLFDEGFTTGQTTDDGNFEEEGYADIKWSSTISEVELDLSSLASLCEGFAASDDEASEESVMDCRAMFEMAGGLESILGSFTGEIGQSIRAVELTVTWPVGKYSESLSVKGLVTREDFGIQQEPLPGNELGNNGMRSAPGSGAGNSSGSSPGAKR